MTIKKGLIGPCSFMTKLNGENVEICFERETIYIHDKYEGADSDGNRGEDVTYIDEDFAHDVHIIDNDGNEVTEDVEAYYRVSILIDEWMRKHKPIVIEDDV